MAAGMSSTSPQAQFSPSTSTYSGGQHPQSHVKSEHGEAKTTKPKAFVCDKCGKRYARRDYLERHSLNHEARSFKCDACGKGFARIDVLKKHEAVACKMLRPADSPRATAQGDSSRGGGGNGNSAAAGTRGHERERERERPRVKESRSRSRANSPLHNDERAGAAPHSDSKRRKVVDERRYLSPASSSSSASSNSHENMQAGAMMLMDMEVGLHGREPFERRFSGLDPQQHPQQYQMGGHPDHHHQHHHHQQQQQQQRYSLPHINATPLHPPTHLPPIQTGQVPPHTYNSMLSPTQPKDMSISLAPAYAPTPDVSDLTHDPAPLKSDPDPSTSRSTLDHAQQQPTSAHPDSGQTIEWEDTTVGPGGGASVGSNGGDFGMGGKVGENMDDLLGWLFNTNAPNTGGDWAFGIQQGQIQQDMQGHQFLPTFALDPINNVPADMGPVDSFANASYQQDLAASQFGTQQAASQQQQQQQQPQQQQQQQWLPPVMQQQGFQHDANGNRIDPSTSSSSTHANAQSGGSGSGNLTVHRRYPQAFHPLYVPNIPGKTNIPNFSGSEKILVQGREKYKEVIDEDVRNSMLEMFEGPGKRELMSPAFSLQRMRLYLELYFMHFAPLYPIIHQPSLRFRRLPPDLLLALICIGTAFAEDKEGLRIASKLHKRLRNRIFESVEDEPKASVHSLQTLLLINHFSRSYCSLKEHDISQIFHSPSVYMIRLAGTLLPKFTRQNAVSDDPVTCWLDWVCEEERKRLGWFAFMMDLENAALYRHFLMIHCYFMEIPFPTSSPSWTAPDPFTWSTALRESLSVPTPSFRNALRELAGRGTVPPNLNDQSLWILIHGLINVSWTLLWRDLGELSMVHENKITGWKDSLRRAFKTWVGHVEGRAAVCEEALYTVGIPFAQLGSILLLSDTEEIRIFAGASNIAGRSISPGEWTAANTYVHAWARSQDGAYACYTAVELLSQVYKWSAEDRWATAPAFIPWCTYVSSLIIWAYTTVLDGPDSLQAPYIIPMTNNADKPLEHGQMSEIRIEPSLARRAAQKYIVNMLQQTQGEAFALPDVQGKNACAGVLAYTAYLMGIGGRGVLDEARRVLLGLLGEG